MGFLVQESSVHLSAVLLRLPLRLHDHQAEARRHSATDYRQYSDSAVGNSLNRLRRSSWQEFQRLQMRVESSSKEL